VRIARLGGFRRAAEDLSVSQSALSQQMKLLEAELRAPLFERAYRPVRLTEAGSALLERAESILQELRSTREEVQAFAGLARGHVRVGTLPAHGAGWTAPMLSAFHRQHPRIELDIAEHNSAVLLDLLLDRTLDIACLNVPASRWTAPPGVCLAAISQIELVFALPADHRLGSLTHAPLSEFASEPLILPPHSSIAWIVDDAFRARGLSHSVRFHITDQRTVLELAAGGLGVAVTTSNMIAQHSVLGLQTVRAADASLSASGVAAWTERGVRNKAVVALVNHAQAWARTADWPGRTPVLAN
jgi:DNA-binding transcriptional LysR family regulator